MGKLSNYSLKSYNYIAKKCISAIAFSHYLSQSKPLFDSLDILKFESLVIQRISLLMCKYSTWSVPPPIMGLFKKRNEVHTHFTRNSISLCTLRGKSEERYNTFSFKEVHILNHISRNVNTCVSYSSFKKIVKL